MGARGKKRVRANGQIASGKQPPLPRPLKVPSVKPEQVQEALDVLRGTIAETRVSARSGPEWDATYRAAQGQLHARHPRMLADAILWRATFLHALIDWAPFKELHRGDGELPTADMLEVAATIPTYGDEESFDMEDFEELLAHASQSSTA
ncbi:MAG: hypothetical protein QOI38_1719 [Sphingomonadales bacterium]|nr:hypothetical protein [Sphingomonadales bacterium]